MKNLYNLFTRELADMQDSEQRIEKALPKLIEEAHSPVLKKALNGHLEQTKEHLKKVKQIFEDLDELPRMKTCDAIVGILKEGSTMASENKGKSSIDAAIIAACQKVEHYEIGTYKTLKVWAELLGNEEAAETLAGILEEEWAASERLGDIADEISQMALAES